MAEYRVLHRVESRRAGDAIEVWDRKRDRAVHLEAWAERVLDAVNEEAPLARLAEIVPTHGVTRRARRALDRSRRFVYYLWQMGYVDIPGETPPGLVAGRYRRVRELGRGGVGIAYLYSNVETGEPVVVKRAWDFLQRYAITEAAMQREAAVLGNLDHRGTVKLLDTAMIDGHLHIVREFLDGDDLTRAVGSGWTDAARRQRVASEIADILAHLHERGFVLLDLRPANFLLRNGESPVLIDVGQCREHGGGSLRFPRRIGSPGFTSPEMEREKRVDVRSDVWGLGRLMVHLAGGPFPVRAPSEALLERVPAAERARVAQFLAEDPAARPQTAIEAKAVLLRANV